MAITGGGAAEEVQVAISGDADGLNEATNSAVDSLGSLRKAAGLASGALAALGAAGLGAAATAAARFEEQMVEVEKVTNPETAERMGDAIQEMASRMPVAQKELAGITAQAGRFGIQGTENIERFTETVSKMAIATDLSTSRAGESFARLSTLMDTPISRVGDMGNVVNELSNTMATSSSEIVDSALRSSGTLSQLGASSEDIFALNAAMNAASESAERAGTRLRRMSQEIQDPKKVKELSVALGMSTEEFSTMREESPVDLFREMASTMGEGGEAADALRSTLSTTSQQALTAMAQNMEGLAAAQQTANEQMENGTSLQEEYAAASDTFFSELQVVQNQLRNVAIQIGENVLPVLSDLLSGVSDAIGSFSSLNEESDGLIGTLGLIGVTIGGIAGAVGLLISGPLGLLAGAIAALAAAFAADFGNMRDVVDDYVAYLEEYLGLARAIITDFAEAFGVASTSAGDFRDRVEGAVASAVDVVESLLQRARRVLQRLRAYWEANGEAIAQSVADTYFSIRDRIEDVLSFVETSVIQPFIDAVSSVWNRHGDALRSDTAETWRVIRDRIDTAIGLIQSGVQKGHRRLRKFWDRHGDRIMSIVKTAFDTIATVVETVLNTVARLARVGLAVVRGDFDEAWRLIREIVDDAMDFVANVVQSGIDSVVTFVSGIGRDDIKAAFKKIGSAIRTIVLGVFGAAGTLFGIVKDFVGDLATYIGSGQALTDLKRAFRLLMGGVVAVVKVTLGATGTVIGIVRDLISDIATYIGSGQAYTDIKNAFQTLVGAAMAAFEGLYEGLIGNSLIPDMMSDIKAELLDWASWVKGGFADLVGDAFDGVAGKIAGALSDISIDWPTLPDWLDDALDEVSGGIEDAIDWVEDQAPGGGGGGNSGSSGSDDDGGGSSGSSSGGGGDDDGFSYDPGDGASGGIGNPGYGTGLATGGIVTDATRAIVGEGSESEAVMPLSKLEQFVDRPAGGTTVVIKRIEASGQAEGRAAGRALRNELDALDI